MKPIYIRVRAAIERQAREEAAKRDHDTERRAATREALDAVRERTYRLKLAQDAKATADDIGYSDLL